MGNVGDEVVMNEHCKQKLNDLKQTIQQFKNELICQVRNECETYLEAKVFIEKLISKERKNNIEGRLTIGILEEVMVFFINEQNSLSIR